MISINGITYHGNNISISNNKIIIDGKDVTAGDNSKDVKIEVNGNLESLNVDYCNTIKVSGEVGDIRTTSGDVECGDVRGKVRTTSGDIESGDVGAGIETMSGDIKCENVSGDATTISGDIKKRKSSKIPKVIPIPKTRKLPKIDIETELRNWSPTKYSGEIRYHPKDFVYFFEELLKNKINQNILG